MLTRKHTVAAFVCYKLYILLIKLVDVEINLRCPVEKSYNGQREMRRDFGVTKIYGGQRYTTSDRIHASLLTYKQWHKVISPYQH